MKIGRSKLYLGAAIVVLGGPVSSMAGAVVPPLVPISNSHAAQEKNPQAQEPNIQTSDEVKAGEKEKLSFWQKVGAASPCVGLGLVYFYLAGGFERRDHSFWNTLSQ